MKYEITGYEHPINKNLYKIRALRDIPRFNVKNGDLGGYIEKERNLPQNGDAWVSSGAQIFGNAFIHGNALAFGDSRIYGNAGIFNNARIYGKAVVCGDAMISGNARICDSALIRGGANIYGNAAISGRFMRKMQWNPKSPGKIGNVNIPVIKAIAN